MTATKEQAQSAQAEVRGMEEEEQYCQQRSKISLEKGIQTLSIEFKATETKTRNYDVKMFSLRIDIKELAEKFKVVRAKVKLYHREAMVFQQKTNLEQKITLLMSSPSNFNQQVKFLGKKLGVCSLQGKKEYVVRAVLILILHKSIIKLTRTCYIVFSCQWIS